MVLCITSVCLSFLLPKTKAEKENNLPQQIIAEDTGASSAGKEQKGGVLSERYSSYSYLRFINTQY